MLKIKNLTFKGNGNTILDNISCELPLGTIVGLLGSSGSGKTSLMRCIGRLESTQPGDILFKEKTIFDLGPEKIGMVFQQFNLFPHMTVKLNLCHSPVIIGKLSPTEANEKARELLKDFGLESKADVHPQLLSGGQKQRVAIARAMMMDPEIILFDEPTSALDPEMVDDVAELINKLKSPDRLIIVATHELKVCRLIADRILFLDHGQLVENTSKDEFFNNPKSDRAKVFIEKTRS